MSGRLGLIAGDGEFPALIARAARAQRLKVVAIHFPGFTDPALADDVDAIREVPLGALDLLVDTLREEEIRDVVLVGKISKASLYGSRETLQLDDRARRILLGLRDRGDDAIMHAFAEVMESEGIAVRSQVEWLPELLAELGTLGAVRLDEDQWADVRFGWEIAKGVGSLGIGQTVVVKDRAVLAVEAIEGSDEAIRRGSALSGGGACVVKVARPDQDLRFDLPAVGPATIDAMQGSGAAVLAVESGCTVLLDRRSLVARADEFGIALIGVDSALVADNAGASV